YRNLHVIGWDGGQLTGFGAARSAALAFADTLPYRPGRVIMMDQDVVQSPKVRLTEFGPGSTVERAHRVSRVSVIGLGVGYPTRVTAKELQGTTLSLLGVREPKARALGLLDGAHPVPQRPASFLPEPADADYQSPVQQAVSIEAPFRSQGKAVTDTIYADGHYPSFMVTGGEDMLMGRELGLPQVAETPVLRSSLIKGRIVKKGLEGPADTSNKHWSVLRASMLATLYAREKLIDVSWCGNSMTLEKMIGILEAVTGVEDTHNTSSNIVERIILKLHKLRAFPADLSRDMFMKKAVAD
ncbi:MAG TPA: hypothetical protein VEQ58_01245, partial [Polyangiaceae bacterium]|nr:hypothetical protein [Polyangiaceae bacterium]